MTLTVEQRLAAAERKRANDRRRWHAQRDRLLSLRREWLARPETRSRLAAYRSPSEQTPRRVLYHRVKRWMNKHLKNGHNRRWTPKLGYTMEDLRAHLERQFVAGMSWENRDQWHIDHIRPVASFSFTSPDDPDFRECYALANLRPLWAADNLRKGARYDARDRTPGDPLDSSGRAQCATAPEAADGRAAQGDRGVRLHAADPDR